MTTPTGDPRRFCVRYFSPNAEVPFCGHATVAEPATGRGAADGRGIGVSGTVTRIAD